MLADRGYLRKVGGTWRLERADELPLPESVQGIIAARLDALAPEDKALLQDAAVLGKVGWLGALAALGGAEPFVLEQRGCTPWNAGSCCAASAARPVAGERQYAFRHVLVRDVAYGQLPRAARATSTGGRPSGWRRCRRTGPRTGPSCSPTTGRPPSSTPRPPARTPPCWPSRPGWPCGRPATGPWSSTPSPPPPAGMRPRWSCGRPTTRAAAAAAAARAGPNVW